MAKALLFLGVSICLECETWSLGRRGLFTAPHLQAERRASSSTQGEFSRSSSLGIRNPTLQQ